MEEREWQHRQRQPEGTVLYEAARDNLTPSTHCIDQVQQVPGCVWPGRAFVSYICHKASGSCLTYNYSGGWGGSYGLGCEAFKAAYSQLQ